MKITIDKKYGMGYIDFIDPEEIRSKKTVQVYFDKLSVEQKLEKMPDLILDIDKDNKLVGIEFFDYNILPKELIDVAETGDEEDCSPVDD